MDNGSVESGAELPPVRLGESYDGEPDYRQVSVARPGVDFIEPDEGPERPPVFLPDADEIPLPLPAELIRESAPPVENAGEPEVLDDSYAQSPNMTAIIAESRARTQGAFDGHGENQPAEASMPVPSAPRRGRWVAPVALILAILALILVLSASPSAKVAPHSIGSSQIAPGSLTVGDFVHGSLPAGIPGSPGVAGATGATGPAGPRGPAGRNGTNGTNGKNGTSGKNGSSSGSTTSVAAVTYLSQTAKNLSGIQSLQVSCTGSLKVIGGGASVSGDGAVLSANTVSGNGWSATAMQLPTSSSSYGLTVTAVCAKATVG